MKGAKTGGKFALSGLRNDGFFRCLWGLERAGGGWRVQVEIMYFETGEPTPPVRFEWKILS